MYACVKNANVAFRDEVVHQVRPRRLDEFSLHAERFGERLGHVDIDTFELAVCLVKRVRLVVTRRTGAQRAAREDFVEPGGRRGRGAGLRPGHACVHQNTGQNAEQCECCLVHRVSLVARNCLVRPSDDSPAIRA
jgi:hypothetical protein